MNAEQAERIRMRAEEIRDTLDTETCVATLWALRAKGLDVPSYPKARPDVPRASVRARKIAAVTQQLASLLQPTQKST